MAREIRSSTLFNGKVPILQDISYLPLKVIKKKHHFATINDAGTNNSLYVRVFPPQHVYRISRVIYH